MIKKRLWMVLFAIPICLASMLVVNAQRSLSVTVGGAIDPTCVSALPCIEYDNNGSGPGIRGVGATGNGVGGTTRNNSTSVANGTAGVFGNDQSTSGVFDSGVLGRSVRGTGVFGHSVAGVGVSGTSTSANGMLGSSAFNSSSFSNATAGVLGQDLSTSRSSFNSGVTGITSTGIAGVTGETLNVNSTGGAGLRGTAQGNGSGLEAQGAIGVQGFANNNPSILEIGIFGFAIDGPGIDGFSRNFPGLVASNETAAAPALKVFGNGHPTAPLITATGGGSNDIMSLDQSGNLILAGTLTQNGTPLLASRGAGGRNVITYGPRESEPTVEDMGTGEVVNGRAYVRLDAGFAAIIDPSRPYLVFITPEADNNGIYVAEKSLAGFTVRESRGGHSTFGFDYRVVAKPYDTNAPRLAAPSRPLLQPTPAEDVVNRRLIEIIRRQRGMTANIAANPNLVRPR